MAVKESNRKRENAEEVSEATPSKKQHTVLSVAVFQKRLRKEGRFNALEEFIHLCRGSKHDDLATHFLKEGGLLTDIINCLKPGRSNDLAEVSIVFSTLHLLLLRVLTKVPEQRKNAEEVCHFLLSNHLNVIHSMIGVKSNPKFRKVVLQLLTAVVTLNASLAKDVLNYVSLSLDVVNEIVRIAKPDDVQNVRTCYIQFIMAFLVEGSPSIIRLLLEKRLILTSIILELQYDPFQLVIFVVTTLRTKLVEIKEIPKTLKMCTFNTNVMRDLLNLYKWKGPAAWKLKKNDEEQSQEITNSEQQEAVAEAVHALFLALCTSFRHGILFRDNSLGSSKSKPNTLVASVLMGLKHPWDDSLETDLFLQVIKVSPDFAHIAYSKVAPVLYPRASPAWIKAINFVTQVVACLKLEGLTSLEPNSALKVAKTLTAPHLILNAVASPGLLHEHPTVRMKTIELLLTISQAVKPSIMALSGRQAEEFRHHISKVLPNGAVLNEAWKLVILNPISEKTVPIKFTPNSSPSQQMLGLVELMALYQQLFPLLLNIGDTHSELSSTLVKALDLNNLDGVLEIQVKILQILSLLDTSVLDTNKDGFKNAVALLLQASCKSESLAAEAQTALGSLLLKCRVLEPGAADMTGELGVWLQNCQIIKSSQRNRVISFLQDVIVCIARNPSFYIEKSLKAQEPIASSAVTMKKKHMGHAELAEQFFQELLSMGDVDKSFQSPNKREKETREKNRKEIICFDDCYSSVELSGLLMCVLDNIEANENLDASVEKYLSYVLVHLLHMQGDPQPFINTVSHWASMPRAVLQYLNSWLSNEPIALTKPFESCSPEKSLSHMLLESISDIPELEDCSSPITILFLERLVLFHIAQLTEKQLLTEAVSSASVGVFTMLLGALQETISHCNSSVAEKFYARFFNLILRHPVLLCYFSPLHKKKRLSENMVTNLILDFLEKAASFEPSSILKKSSVPLKEKLYRNILHYLEKSDCTLKRTQTLMKAMKTLTLTRQEMCNLISKLCDKFVVHALTELLCHLLCNVTFLPSEQVIAIGNNIFKCLQEEEDMNSSVWDVVDAFHHYLKQYPNSVLHVPSNLFQLLICKRGVNLASILMHHQKSLVPVFTNLVEQKNSILPSADVLYPLVIAATHHGPPPSSLLNVIYSQYQQDIIKSMEAPLSDKVCFGNHPDFVKELIVECMDSDVCHDLSNSLNNNWEKLGLCTSFHLSVIHGLQVLGRWRNMPNTLVQLLLHQIKEMFQKKAPLSLIIHSCSLLGTHLNDNQIKWQEQELHLEEELPVLFLLNGLSGSDSNLTHWLFETFARLLWRAKAVKMAGRVFDMVLSHSRFLDIVLVPEHGGTKLAVLQLLLTCGRLAPRAMQSAQIPVWLGAYGASLSHSDQTILKILHCLDIQKNINLNAYRPFLWGDAAVNHYSVRSRAGMSLFRIPQATVVLELLQKEMMKNTIANFPIHRKLFFKHQNDLHDTENFISEDLEPSQPNVYDPAFMMPVLSHIMAPESVVQDFKFNNLGGLAMTLASLGSECGFMRAAAVSVLSRYYNRLNPRKRIVQLDQQFIECIRAGIRNLKSSQRCQTTSGMETNESHCDFTTNTTNDETSKNEIMISEQISPKVPNLSAIFLARVSLVFADSLHSLYLPLHEFVLAKPAMELKTVPELQRLLRPGNVDFRIYQMWFLKTVQCGMRTQEDLRIARGCHLFKMLFTLFSSCLADASTKLLILRVLEATLKIPNSISVLIKCGILPWLHAVFNSVEREEEDCHLVIAFIRLLVSLKEYSPSLCKMVIPLILKLPSVMHFSDILSILQVALDFFECLTDDHIIVLLQLCQEVVLDQKIIQECYSHMGLTEIKLKNSEIHINKAHEATRELEIKKDAPHKVMNDESCTVEKRTAISDLLKSVVFKRLTYINISFETKRLK